MFDLLGQDPRGERRDRLVAEGLLDRTLSQAGRVAAQQLPLVRRGGEQPDRVGQLALARVDAANEDVEHEVAQFILVEAVAGLLGGDQVGDQIIGGRQPPLDDQLVDVRIALRHRLLDLGARGRQAERVELALDHG